MGSEFVELSSSDEGEESGHKKRAIGDDDDVIIIDKSQCASFVSRSSSRNRDRKLQKVVLPVDADDCCIVEPSPTSITAIVETDGDELVVTGEVGPIACRDYPHARHLCARFVFAETAHESCCEQCHCYVCDKLAPCESWITHCHASDKEEHWKILRKTAKLPPPIYKPPPPPPLPPSMYTSPPPHPSYRPRVPYTAPYTAPTGPPRTMGDYARGAIRTPTAPRSRKHPAYHQQVGQAPGFFVAAVSPPVGPRGRGHMVLKQPHYPPTPGYRGPSPTRPNYATHPPPGQPQSMPVSTRQPTPPIRQPATAPSTPIPTRQQPSTPDVTRQQPTRQPGPTTGHFNNSNSTVPAQSRNRKQSRRRTVAASRVPEPAVQVPACSISTAAPLDPSPPTAPDAITVECDQFLRSLFDNEEE